jgi:hypothetical protein
MRTTWITFEKAFVLPTDWIYFFHAILKIYSDCFLNFSRSTFVKETQYSLWVVIKSDNIYNEIRVPKR